MFGTIYVIFLMAHSVAQDKINMSTMYKIRYRATQDKDKIDRRNTIVYT